MVTADLIQEDWFDVALIVLVSATAVLLLLVAALLIRLWRGVDTWMTTFDSDIRALKRGRNVE